MLQVEIHTDLEPLRADWERLAAASRNVFASWEWTTTWWRHFGRGRPLVLGACRSGGEVKAIVPLYVWRSRPISVLRFIGHGQADLLGPVCAADDPGIERAALSSVLETAGCDVFVADAAPGNRDWGLSRDAVVLARTAFPIVGGGNESWEQFLCGRSANLRAQVRRKRRKLAREHEVRFRLATSASLEHDLDVLYLLHEENLGRHEDYYCGASVPFQREFARRALDRGWLRLWTLDVDGVPAAAWHGFRFAGTECFYQSGRARSLDNASVGFVLLAHTIEQAIEDGVDEYRLLRGGESYKYRFATEDTGLLTFAVPRTHAGRLAVHAAALTRLRPLAAVARRATR
jgi:CelD/BcsL family acetyltransferase involved in cellulose biosynthesis